MKAVFLLRGTNSYKKLAELKRAEDGHLYWIGVGTIEADDDALKGLLHIPRHFGPMLRRFITVDGIRYSYYSSYEEGDLCAPTD